MVCVLTMAQADGAHDIDKCVVFCCGESTMVAVAFGSSSWRSGQALVVAGASCVHTLGCGSQLQVSV